jgi:hypothetical protein
MGDLERASAVRRLKCVRWRWEVGDGKKGVPLLLKRGAEQAVTGARRAAS